MPSRDSKTLNDSMPRNVLLVEDDSGVRQFLAAFLESEGLAVTQTWTIRDALEQCAGKRFDLLMLDYNISGGEVGWRVAGEVRAHPDLYGSPRIIAMSGTVCFSMLEALGLPADCLDLFLQKPFGGKDLKKHLASLGILAG